VVLRPTSRAPKRKIDFENRAEGRNLTPAPMWRQASQPDVEGGILAARMGVNFSMAME
jgi:hypothetical protein